MIEEHWDGIASYCHEENKVPLGFVEGINNKIPRDPTTSLRTSRRGVPPPQNPHVHVARDLNGLFSKHLLASESAADLVSLQSRDRVKGHSGVY